jgi:tRNA (guanine37-N1)-methyltransferase
VAKLNITFLTTFPEMFPGTLGFSLPLKALERKVWSYSVVNIRDFGITRHKKVDDQPCGGGAGMIMRPDVLSAALDYAMGARKVDRIFYMSPRGMVLNQAILRQIVECQPSDGLANNIIIICARFEGIDQRVITYYNIEEISIGDFIIFGGELAAMTLAEGCIRLLDGAMSSKDSVIDDSFSMQGDFSGLLEYSLYTKPVGWRSMNVPEVLTSGNHLAINNWKLNQAQQVTKKNRPDLWRSYVYNKIKKRYNIN